MDSFVSLRNFAVDGVRDDCYVIKGNGGVTGFKREGDGVRVEITCTDVGPNGNLVAKRPIVAWFNVDAGVDDYTVSDMLGAEAGVPFRVVKVWKKNAPDKGKLGIKEVATDMSLASRNTSSRLELIGDFMPQGGKLLTVPSEDEDAISGILFEKTDSVPVEMYNDLKERLNLAEGRIMFLKGVVDKLEAKVDWLYNNR